MIAACLSQAGLSAESLALLFRHSYDIVSFGHFGAEAISATMPAGGGQRTGAFQLEAVARIDSVSIELSHADRRDLTFSLTAPNGDVFSLTSSDDFSRGFNPGSLGNGGSDLQGLMTYKFTASGSTLASVVTDPTPGGDYRARSWQSAPPGGWAPGTWTLLLTDEEEDGELGAVGQIEIYGVFVPEPSVFALLAGLCAFARVALRRSAFQSGPPPSAAGR